MPEVSFTKEQLLGRKMLTPKWRTLKVQGIEEKPGTKNPDSITFHIQFLIEAPADDLGVPIKGFFNEETQMERLAGFLQCFITEDIPVGKKFELKSLIGRYVDAMCGYDIKTGFNSISEYKPSKKLASAAS